MSRFHHGNLREALIARAIEVIGEKGVEGLSLRRIAKDLGVSHAAPARHFSSKADLLSTIVAQSYAALTQAVLTAASGAEDQSPIIRLHHMGRGTIEWALENRAVFSVMMNPDVSRYADETLKQSLKTFANVIATAVADAQTAGFRKDVSAHTLLFYAVGAALGVSMLATDELMRSILGAPRDTDAIAAIAEQIVPIKTQ